MMAKTNIKRIAVLTGGGDCPGLNPAIKWVVKTAEDHLLAQREGREQFEVLGIRDGWKGLIEADDPDKVPVQPRMDFTQDIWARVLTEDSVRTWDRLGGTRLGTSRTNPFKEKEGKKEDESKHLVENIEKLGIDAIVAIGGEDTLGVAYRLSKMNIPVVGIPKTIDKDLPGTDYSLGFETAVNVIVEEIDRLRTTAGSHSRVFVVETMGRHAGHLALQGGMASGAYIILIPEYRFNVEKVCDLLWARRERGTRYSIVVAAEAARDDEGKIEELIKQRKERPDQFGHLPMGGIVHGWLRDAIENWAKEREGVDLETRSVDLSHLQRGGSPSAYDRRMGRLFGIGAVNLLVRGESGRMVSFKDGGVTSVSFEEAIGELTESASEEEKVKHLNLVTQDEYDVERYNGRRWVFPATD